MEDLMELKPLHRVDWRPDDPEGVGIFWRFYGVLDEWADEPKARIWLEKWKALRATPRGVWIVSEYSSLTPEWSEWAERWRLERLEREKKLVQTKARRKWAYPTKAEAWESFRIRTSYRVSHARNALAVAEGLFKLIQETNDGKDDS